MSPHSPLCECPPGGCPFVSPHTLCACPPGGLSPHAAPVGVPQRVSHRVPSRSPCGCSPGESPFVSPHTAPVGAPRVGVPSRPLTPSVGVPSHPPSRSLQGVPSCPPWVPSGGCPLRAHTSGWVPWLEAVLGRESSSQTRVILAGRLQSRRRMMKASAPSLETVEIG